MTKYVVLNGKWFKETAISAVKRFFMPLTNPKQCIREFRELFDRRK